MSERGHVLLVDDEPELVDAASEWLGVSGFAVSSFTDPRKAIASLDPDAVDCVVSDLRMPHLDGMELLKAITAKDRRLPVILLTAHGDVAHAVQAMRHGAHDFLEKPYDADHLVAVLDRAIEERRLRREISRLRAELDGSAELDSRLVGASRQMREIRAKILQLANFDVDILVHGETGTGKEVVARALHDFSRRAPHRFVAVNCAAVPETIFESEMFGHAAGAFTDAKGEREGKVEYADGGTLFLDEIESMPLNLQAKILRVLQEREVERLGSNKSRPIDIRVVAATKRDLKIESEAGRFRPDLYYRLSTVELRLPRLAERAGDVSLLFTLFVERAARRFGINVAPPSHGVLSDLATRPFAGNVRELKIEAERYALGLNGAGAASSAPGGFADLPSQVAAFEADLIRRALDASDGSATLAAERLGLPRRTLSEKIARYNLRDPRSGH
ncbi:sigma-54-dependent Fis family transcriptional regulator [Fulvimarina endophytica]|uniref:Sigma-54-dependent Fis family transcriptional regulator n=1 Tax=Fulvimarina endophytica TaxID=2293836 RepID=A0A371XAB1_9HYPH|nr:sigma-54 dependent transcriptional regulator [Fulvimarina endophytica]RFC66141.1 sigma-54-dependent Fis family transcriptional regulator [Fulvimarina endophytica]